MSGNKASGFITKTAEVGDEQVKYVVYIPDSYDPKKPMPAIIFLHGMGECGDDGWRQVLVGLGSAVMLNSAKWPFIIMFPQKQEAGRSWEDEKSKVMSVLEKTKNEYKIDESRLYLTGISQGGHGTWAIAARHPELFAAIAPVCGRGSKEIAEKLVKMPIWVFHGEADPIVKVQCAYDMADWLKDAGGSCKMSIYPGVEHGSWDKAYREEKLYEWFLEHKR